MLNPERALDQIAARQFCCFPRRQASSCGFSEYQMRHRTHTGRWLVPFAGSFQLAGTPVTTESMIAAAVLARADSYIDRGAAAYMWTGRSPTTTGPSIVRPHGRGQPLAGIDLRQSTCLPPQHVTLLGALPITTRARTAFDLAAELSVESLGGYIDDQVVRRKLRLGQVELVFRDLARPGRPGTRTMAGVLDERVGGDPPPESELEARFRRLCERHDLPGGVAQLPAPWADARSGRHRVDVGYPDDRVIVEVDGRTYHAQLAAFQRDRVRDQLAVAAGWRPLRFTWWQVTREEAFVVRILRSVLTLER